MGLDYSTNYGAYNYYAQPRVSGGDKIGHWSEKNWNRTKTGAAIGAVGALGLTGACIANNISSHATTFTGTFAETFPKITNALKFVYHYSGLEWCSNKLKTNEFVKDMKQKTLEAFHKTKNWGLEKAKLTKVVDYFKEKGTIGNKISTSLAGLKDTLKNNYKNMSGKSKLIAGIGLATLSAVGMIWGAGKYQAGKIDQKYADRARFI